METNKGGGLSPFTTKATAAVGSSAGSSTGAGVGQVAGRSSSAAGPTKRIRNTKTQHRPGVLRVKEYPVTEQVLDNIGTLRLSAAFWCAVGSLALGFALSCWQSLSLASAVDEATKAAWKVYRNVGFGIALIAYLAAVFYFFKGKSVIQYVRENTVHDPVD
jgi:hypothetical protein